MDNIATSNTKYIHTDDAHNLQSPKIIVPEIIKMLRPNNVLDVGCGIGTFLRVFQENGIEDVLGVDGSWVDKTKLYIDNNCFIQHDLEKPFSLNRQFDIVICLEVAEHLAEESSDTIINTLTSHGKIIIFSAATKNQGGQNHINEQHVIYWQEKFARLGYVFYDVFRPLFWNNTDVQWWYKQNMFLVVSKSFDISKSNIAPETQTDIFEYIHPELLAAHVAMERSLKNEIDNIIKGKLGFNFYFKLLAQKITAKFAPRS